MFPVAHQRDIKQKIAKNIAVLREEQGMTQLDLGIALGYQVENAQSRISQYETGTRSPGKKTLALIAEVLNVPADQLVKEESSTYNTLQSKMSESDPMARRLLQVFATLDLESKRTVIKYAEERKIILTAKKVTAR